MVCLSVLSLQVIGCYHRDFPYFTLEHPLGHLRLPHLLLQLGLGEVLAELRKALLSVLLPPKEHVATLVVKLQSMSTPLNIRIKFTRT